MLLLKKKKVIIIKKNLCNIWLFVTILKYLLGCTVSLPLLNIHEVMPAYLYLFK